MITLRRAALPHGALGPTGRALGPAGLVLGGAGQAFGRACQVLGRVGQDLLDLLAPVRCAGCQRTGATLCESCRREVSFLGPAGTAARTWPSPCPPGMPPTWATAALVPPLRTVLTAYKDGDRRDSVVVLAPLLALAVRAAAGSVETLTLVPAPASRASRRRRGDDPLAALTRECAQLLPGSVEVVPALRVGRRVRDQSRLGAGERARNLHGALEVRRDRVRDLVAPVVLVDDIVTTGATLTEAARALQTHGVLVRAACIAATARRSPVGRGPRVTVVAGDHEH